MKKVVRQLSFALVMVLVCAGMLQAVETVTGTRNMAKAVISSDTIKYIIQVNMDEGNLPDAVLVEEALPVGWAIKSSTPKISRDSSGLLSWLFINPEYFDEGTELAPDVPISKQAVEDTTITLEIELQSAVCGDALLDGSLKYITGGSQEDTTVSGDVKALIPYGNVNNDTTVNIVDALLIARRDVGMSNAVFNEEEADVNCDGKINIVDALLIARNAVQMVNPAWCTDPCK